MPKVYTIKKGEHYSNHTPKMCYGKGSMRATFKFMDGCWFPLEVQDDYAINKLCGFSNGLHNRNSVRLGWTPNKEPGKIDLFFYLYINGVRKEQKFATVEIGLEYQLFIILTNNLCGFTLMRDGATVATDSVYYPQPRCPFGYWLFPYLGGRLPARVDTKIYLDMK